MKFAFCVFILFPLSTIQQGIQASHCAVRFVRNYTDDVDAQKHKDVLDWADYHETVLLFNGGDYGTLQGILEIVEENAFPCAVFHESPAFLNGLMTYVGVLLPEPFLTATLLEDQQPYSCQTFDTETGEPITVHYRKPSA